MQTLGQTSTYRPIRSLQHQLSSPSPLLPYRAAYRKPASSSRPATAAATTQHEVDALVAQSRRSQNSLEDVASTSSGYHLAEYEAERKPASWLQRLGLPFLKLAATAALVAALAFGPSGAAMAARSGGRAGGSSFGASRSMGGGSSFGGSSSMGSSLGGRGSSASTLSRGTGLGLGTGSYMSIFGPSYGYGVPVQQSGGGGVGGIVIFAIIAALAISFLPGILSGNSSSTDSDSGGERVAVSKVQVGLLGSARQLQRDLERMTRKANTNSPEGLHYLLQETVLALNRNPDYWVYGRGDVQSKRGLDSGEDLFNNISMEERSKFKEETLSNVGGRTSSRPMRRAAPSSSGVNELIVVTIIVASQGSMKIPGINNQEELRTSLNRLGALRSDQVMAVEILWTPQDDDDFYTKDEMFADYPTLNNL